MTSFTPKRHRSNANLLITYADQFEGFPLMTCHGPFIENYLERVYSTLDKALADHPRLLAVRFELQFPVGDTLPVEVYGNASIQRFWQAFKARIAHDRAQAAKYNVRMHDTKVRYIWAREYGPCGAHPHYHCCVLLNRDAYFSLGTLYSDYTNLFSRICEAWASALGINWEQVVGLVHIPENPEYHLNQRDGLPGRADLFYRLSYLCKVATKCYGDGAHAFGCSRK